VIVLLGLPDELLRGFGSVKAFPQSGVGVHKGRSAIGHLHGPQRLPILEVRRRLNLIGGAWRFGATALRRARGPGLRRSHPGCDKTVGQYRYGHCQRKAAEDSRTPKASPSACVLECGCPLPLFSVWESVTEAFNRTLPPFHP